MHPKLLVKIFFLLAVIKTSAQVSGKILLAGQSSHQGTQVLFTKIMTTGVSDSCLTDALGNFFINLSPGYYKIKFVHPGFQTRYYEQANFVQLTNTVTLDTYTMAAGVAVYLSGQQSGVWKKNIHYYLDGSVVVPAAKTLSIEPGTQVSVFAGFQIAVEGSLLAKGTPSERIVLSNDHPLATVNQWNNIYLNNSTSVIDYCILESCNQGIMAYGGSVTISNSIFRYNLSSSIEAHEGNILVTKNEIHHFWHAGISVEYSSTATLTCNHIYNDSITYPGSFTKAIITNTGNVISGNDLHGVAVGVDCSGYGKPKITHNYIHNNYIGIKSEITNINNDTFYISNNTFSKNETVLKAINLPPTSFVNNIVSGSDTALHVNGSMSCNHNLFHNCLKNFSSGLQVPAIGVISGNNGNGDPADMYYNIFMDPKFVQGQAPALESNSPAFQAGNPRFSSHIGQGQDQNCFQSLVQTSLKHRSDAGFTQVYPNPTAGMITVKLDETAIIRIYDPFTSDVEEISAEAGINVIDMSSRQPGIYILQIRTVSGLKSIKVIKT